MLAIAPRSELEDEERIEARRFVREDELRRGLFTPLFEEVDDEARSAGEHHGIAHGERSVAAKQVPEPAEDGHASWITRPVLELVAVVEWWVRAAVMPG
jgi:hypothetical protein